MRKNLTTVLAGFGSLLVWTLAPTPSLACGTGSSTITNLPSLGGSALYAYALSGPGQITGYSYISGDSTYHAFLNVSGALSNLGTLGGSTSIGTAVNGSGQVAGQADLAGDSQTHAFLFTGGNLLDLGTLGGSFSGATALNDAGQVVGSSTLAGDAATVAFLYANGAMTSLGTLGGDYGYASALNNAGMAVGQSTDTNGNTHGFLYSGGQLTDIGTLGSDYTSAFSLNDAGIVVGESSTTNGETHGAIYSAGVLTDVGTFGGTYSSAFGINSNGLVIGYATTTDDQEMHGFVYTAGALSDLGTLGGGYSAPNAINNLGAIVGTSATSNGTYHAFLYQNGQMVDLNTLLPANSGWELSTARLINDAGRIIGLGTYNQANQWFILDLVAGNNPPVAVAGPDQTVDCANQVTLDGSQSSDPDHDALAFEWSVGGTVLGTNVTLATSFPLGTNVVTLKVTDPCGASAQTNLIVRVLDTTPPTVSCPAPSTASSDANCQAPVPNVLSQVVASDNCSSLQSLTITQNPAAGTLVGLGPHSVTVTVTDPSGNAANCATLFTVVDTTAPTIGSVPAPITLSADAHCQAVVPNVVANVVASDNCTPANQLVVTQNPSDGTVLASGQYTITVTVTDASGNSSTAGVSLKIVDTTAPTVVSVPAPITLSADAHCQAVVPNVVANVVASDNCTPANQLVITQNPSAGTVLASGQYTITVTVTDASGNSSTAGVSLSIVDTTAPTIVSVPAPITVSADAHCQALVPNVLPNVVASDNCTPANQLVMSQSPAAGTVVGHGQYTITVTVTDAAGNSTSLGIPLTVADTTPPAIQSLTVNPSVLSPPHNKMVAVTLSVTATDNCDPSPVTKLISITCNAPTAPGDMNITGNLTASVLASKGPSATTRIYTLTVQSTDISGNSSTRTVTVTVPGK